MLLISFLLACTGDDPASSPEPDDSGQLSGDSTDTGGPPLTSSPPCDAWALVTDIDETLTTSDGEWLSQLLDNSYVPAARPDGPTLMQAYADKGYRIVYMTARGEDMASGDARALTTSWLLDHGFPFASDDDLVLAEGIGALGASAVEYKTAALQAEVDAGWSFPMAYGNADSDMLAFESQVPIEHLYLVGELAGTEPYQGISDADAYTAHLAVLDAVPAVPAPCQR